MVVPEETVRFDVPSSSTGRHALCQTLSGLPCGSWVALFDSGISARRRSRRLAARAGVRVSGEYLAIPSVAAPLYLVEDRSETLSYFWSRLLVFPLKPPAFTLAEFARGLGRSIGVSGWPGWLGPGRLTVGRRA